MTEPLLNWGYFLGFLGVVLAVIFAYWWVLNRVFDWAHDRQLKAEQAADQALAELKADMEQRRKVLNAAISWKVKPR